MPFAGMARAYKFSTYSINQFIHTTIPTPITMLLCPCISKSVPPQCFSILSIFLRCLFRLKSTLQDHSRRVDRSLHRYYHRVFVISWSPAGGPPDASSSSLVASPETANRKSKSIGTASENVGMAVLGPGVGWRSSSSTLGPGLGSTTDRGASRTLLGAGGNSISARSGRCRNSSGKGTLLGGRPSLTDAAAAAGATVAGATAGEVAAAGLLVASWTAAALSAMASSLSSRRRSKAVCSALLASVAATSWLRSSLTNISYSRRQLNAPWDSVTPILMGLAFSPGRGPTNSRYSHSPLLCICSLKPVDHGVQSCEPTCLPHWVAASPGPGGRSGHVQ